MVGSTSQARKAWNEAMRSAAGGKLPIAGMPSKDNRRSDRQKRREKARKSTFSFAKGSSGSDMEEYRNAVRLEILEGVEIEMIEEEEEYDELDEFNAESGGRKRQRTGASKKKSSGLISKRFKPRSLASILIEESSRSDGVSKKNLDAEARPFKYKYPTRKFCPVTGLEGLHNDPKSGIPYANAKALGHIRERSPPWMGSLGGGTASYFEAVKSLRNED